ncbi:MAG: class I SAM-dependent methyltransferase, partial [Gemmatimonas sp.]
MSEASIDLMPDPLGLALREYLTESVSAELQLVIPSSRAWPQDIALYFPRAPQNDIERAVLSRVRGRVLDIGAGAGRASLLLQDGGLEVLAIDVSPGAVAVMQERGVRHAACIDWESQLRKGAES